MSLDRPKHAGCRHWPGERHPTRWDVHDANESPAVTFLDRFRVALLHSEDAEEDVMMGSVPIIDDSQTMNITRTSMDPVELYTYPMALLSAVPAMPSEDELARLQEGFFTCFKQHIFINKVDIVGTLSTIPPYLQLALACISSVTSPLATVNEHPDGNGTFPADVSASSFVAGVHLWSVMLEVDNREARLLEAVLAAALLITYGILSTDRRDCRLATGLLANVATISRRLHLTDYYPPLLASSDLSEKEFSTKSSLINYMLLTDVMHAIHCGTVLNYSVSELLIRMPSTNRSFRTIYNLLAHGKALPQDVKSPEDSLLLLTALLSDIIYMQRCHMSTLPLSISNDNVLRNPYAPLSVNSECWRLKVDMMTALSQWENHFRGKVENDILALHCFAKLHLACPALWELPRMAGYGGSASLNPNAVESKQIDIPDKAMDLAWLVLDHCDRGSKPTKPNLSIWLPIILFISSLVVWQRLRSQSATDLKYGTLKVLSMFRNEIARQPWPCCLDMTSTLDRLMQN